MFYDKYIQLCEDKKISPNKAAIEMGFNRASVFKWKNGSLPQGDSLNAVARYFGVPVKFFTNEPPFDAWDYIKDDPRTSLNRMWVDDEMLFILTGISGIDSLNLINYIKFIDNAIEQIALTESGEFDVKTKPWVDLQIDNVTQLNADKKTPATSEGDGLSALDKDLIRMMTNLNDEEAAQVRAFVRGLKARSED